MSYYLAIDQGTHASRACLFDANGRLVSTQTANISLKRISSSHIEQDADEIVDSVKQVIAAILSEVDDEADIKTCGVAIQRSSVVAWQEDGSAISSVLSWQDTRGAHQLDALREHATEIQSLSGLPLSAHYGATKLHYLIEQNTDKSGLRLSPLISYLLFHILEQRPYISDHTNAQRTQLFDLNDLNWSSRLTELFDVPARFLPDCKPVLSPPQSPHGILTGTNIPVCAISGDQNAALYGAGHFTADTALINFGSGAFVLSMLEHNSRSEKQLSGIACSDASMVQYVREATINGAGSALSWFEKAYKVDDLWQQLPAWLDEIDQPPLFINTIGGLGSPWWQSEITAEFITHKNATTDIASQAVAVIESIVFMVCVNLALMQREQNITRLRLSGGLSQLDGLCQRLADVSGLTVERLHLSEATARGAAWLAAGQPPHWSEPEHEDFTASSKPALSERFHLFSTTLTRLTGS